MRQPAGTTPPPARTARTRLVGHAAVAAADGVRVVILRRGAGAAATAAAERQRAAGARVLVVSAAEIARLTGGGGTEEVLAMAGADPAAPLDRAVRAAGPAWLLVGLAYPGNIGLAIRTAEVSGAAMVAVAPPIEGAARRAALRASIGAHRFVPVFWTDAAAVVAAARGAGRRVVALESSGTSAPWEADLTGAVLLVAGGERGGVPPDVLAGADVVVRLPTAGVIPSYNVSAAVAATASERLRQESLRRT